jgi:hypothetical protein
MSQDPIHGTLEIVDNDVGLARPVFALPGFLANPPPGANVNGLAARAESHFHVQKTVAHDEGAMQIEVVFARGSLKHSGSRLATFATIASAVGAIVDAIQLGTVLAQLLLHVLVDLPDE